MFPHRKTIFLVASLLLSAYLSAQTRNPNPATPGVTDPPAVNGAPATAAELLMPRELLVRRVLSGLNSRSITSPHKAASVPYKRPLNAMMMWTETDNFVAKFVDNNGTLGNSDLYDSGGFVGIGTTSPASPLDVEEYNSNSVSAIRVQSPNVVEFGTFSCCGGGPAGSSIGATGGYSAQYNGVFLNSNRTADSGNGGAQVNTGLPSWRMALGSGTLEWAGGDNFAIGRVAAGGSYGSPSVLFSVNNSGKIKVAGGVDATGGGLKHVRNTGCTTGSNGTCTVSIQWPTSFTDSNYTASCSNASGNQMGFSNKTATSLTVNIINITAGIPSGEIDCIAMHD